MNPRQYIAFLLLLAGAAALCGCQSVRLPRIDPSGEQIFLPPPNYTTLNSQAPGDCFPEPVWKTPPLPPDCPPEIAVPGDLAVTPPTVLPPATAPTVPVLPAPPQAMVVPQPTATVPVQAPPPQAIARSLCLGQEPHDATMMIDPPRMVAPVGSQVVLTAGMVLPDRTLVSRQPVEWLLAEGSAGNFVEVGGEGQPAWRRVLGCQARKLDGGYAIGRTAAQTQLISRGTPDPADDTWVLAGQTWISVTSATEGTSRVTALARQIEGWDRRQQTAEIHWIDAQWSFPASTVRRSGESHVMTTSVTRLTSGAPINGWIVRYEILEGDAAFAPSNAQVAEVPTDANGHAAVELIPLSPNPGVARVNVQVVRPETIGDALPRLVTGEAIIAVNWSTAALTAQITGPDRAEIGSEVTYDIDVSNSGNVTTSAVSLSNDLPVGLTHVGSNPPARVYGNRVQWQLGDLSAGQTRRVQLTVRGTQPGEMRQCATAQSTDGLVSEACKSTNFAAQALSIRMEGPTVVQVGEQAQFRVVVTNQGRNTLRNVRVIDSYGPGFQHAERRSPIERMIGDLAAGQSIRFAVTFAITQSGQLCHTLQASADGGQSTAIRACVTSVVPAEQPQIVGPVIPGPTIETPAPSMPTLPPRVIGPVVPQPRDELPTPSLEPPPGGGRWVPPGESAPTPIPDDRAAEPPIGPSDETPTEPDRFEPRVLPREHGDDQPARPTPPQKPVLEVSKTAPKTGTVGETVIFRIEVRNVGDVAATSVKIADEFPASLRPVNASRGFTIEDGALVWDIGHVEPNTAVVRQVQCQCVLEDGNACNRAIITADGGIREERQSCLVVSKPMAPQVEPDRVPQHPPAGRDNGAPTVDEGPPVSGKLIVTLADQADPVKLGERITYLLVVKNDRRVSDKDVTMSIQIPAGLRFEKLTGPTRVQSTGRAGRTISVVPIAELRADEQQVYRFEATATQKGKRQIRVTVNSLRTTKAITIEEETTVLVE